MQLRTSHLQQYTARSSGVSSLHCSVTNALLSRNAHRNTSAAHATGPLARTSQRPGYLVAVAAPQKPKSGHAIHQSDADPKKAGRRGGLCEKGVHPVVDSGVCWFKGLRMRIWPGLGGRIRPRRYGTVGETATAVGPGYWKCEYERGGGYSCYASAKKMVLRLMIDVVRTPSNASKCQREGTRDDATVA